MKIFAEKKNKKKKKKKTYKNNNFVLLDENICWKKKEKEIKNKNKKQTKNDKKIQNILLWIKFYVFPEIWTSSFSRFLMLLLSLY